MKEIEGYPIDHDLSHYHRVADLISFDGPLLSHYVSENGEDYLFYWVDSDAHNNRWIVVRVSLPVLQQYIGKKLSLREVLLHPNDGYLYTVDIDDCLHYHNIKLVQPSHLPADYLPAIDAYYEYEPIVAADAPAMMTYEVTIPYQEHRRLEAFLTSLGTPIAALKRLATTAAIF